MEKSYEMELTKKGGEGSVITTALLCHQVGRARVWTHLELYLVRLYADETGPELDPDGEVVDWLEALVSKLKQ